MAGFGECAIGRLAVTEMGVDDDVAGRLVPRPRGSFFEGALGVDDPRKLLVLDVERLCRVERFVPRFGHDHRNGFAHVARLVRRQQPMRAFEDPAAAGARELHVFPGGGERIVRNRAEAVGRAVSAAVHADNARHRPRAGGVDAENARVRMRRAHHGGVRLPFQVEVVAELPGANEEAQVFLARQRSADCAGFDTSPARLVHPFPLLSGAQMLPEKIDR